MQKNILTSAKILLYSFITTIVFAISFTNAQNGFNNNQDIGFFGTVSVKVYCTFSDFVPGSENSACDTDILVNDNSTDQNAVETKNGTTTLSESRSALVNNAINRTLNNKANVVYVQGPAGRDGANGTTTVVYQTAIAGAASPGYSAYIYAGGNNSSVSNPYQTTVPGDIYSTFIHFLTVEEIIGNLANITNLFAVNITASNTNTINLLFTNSSGTNSTTTNLFATWANFVNAFAENLSFSNATGTALQLGDLMTTNINATGTATITNANISNLLNTYATITNATITNLRVGNCTEGNVLCDGGNDTGAIVGADAPLTMGTLNAGNINFITGDLGTPSVTPGTVKLIIETGLAAEGAGAVRVRNSLKVGQNITASGTITTTNLVATGTFSLATGTISSATITNSTSTKIFATNASITNATTTNLFASLFKTLNAQIDSLSSLVINTNVLNASTTNASTTNTRTLFVTGTSTFATTTTASSTVTSALNVLGNLFANVLVVPSVTATNATLSNATTTNFFATGLNALNAKIDNLVFGNATGTNLQLANLSLTNINATGTATIISIFANRASMTNATITNATTSNLFANFFRAFNSTIDNLTTTTFLGTNATITNATTSNFATTNLTATGTFTLATGTIASTSIKNLNVTSFGSDALQNIATNTTNSLTFATGTNLLTSIVNGKISTTSLADLVGGGGGTSTSYIALRQVANVATTSTNITNDNELQFNIGANEKWIVQANINYDSTGTGNPTMGLAFTNSGAGATCNYGITSSSGNDETLSCGSLLDTSVTGASHNAILTGVVTSTGAGVIRLGFARVGGSSGTATILAGSSFVAYKVTGADLAEVYFSKDNTVEEGDIVALDGSGISQVAKASKNYQKNILGIVSTKPGLVIGDTDGEGKAVIVGLSGRVPVKVTDKNGKIKAGDFITSSDIPGVAMKATGAGQVIGQALIDDNGSGKIMVFIKNTYHDGTTDEDTEQTIADKFTSLIKNTFEKLSDVYLNMTLVISSLKAKDVNASKVTVKELCVGETCFTEEEMKEFKNYLNSKKQVEQVQEVVTTPEIIQENATTTETISTPVEAEIPQVNTPSTTTETSTEIVE